MHAQVGTPFYVAPEISQKNSLYTQKCDLWSVGIIMYMILTKKPFSAHNSSSDLFSIEFQKPSHELKEILNNESLKNFPIASKLLKKLLKINPEQRFSAKKALESSWLKTIPFDKSNYQEIVNKLIYYKEPKKLEDLIMKMILKKMEEAEITFYKRFFLFLDKTFKGKISTIQLLNFLTNDAKISAEELEKIKKNFQIKKNLSYTEFLMIFLQKEIRMNMEKLINNQNKDELFSINIKDLLENNGKRYKEDEIIELIKENNSNFEGITNFSF